MWNSPRKRTDAGKRYQVADLAALILPLPELLNFNESPPLKDLVNERILKPLERGEFVFALYEVLDALLEETKVPKKGHTGIQEALIAELLDQAHTIVCCELDDPEGGDLIRRRVWMSIERLLIGPDQNAPSSPWLFENLQIDLTDPTPYRSPQLNDEAWEELLLGDGGLFDEFLWDTDWRIDDLMDLPPAAAEITTRSLGLDLDVVQALPHSPTPDELKMAEHYLRFLIWKSEVILARLEQ